MDLYREIILDHYKHPRNFGELEKPDAKASEYNATCGDRITMEVKSQKSPARNATQSVAGGKIKSIGDIRFSGEGCAISMASASMLTEKVTGMRLKDVIALGTNDIVNMLGTELTPSRTKCALLPLEVLQKAIISVQS